LKFECYSSCTTPNVEYAAAQMTHGLSLTRRPLTKARQVHAGARTFLGESIVAF